MGAAELVSAITIQKIFSNREKQLSPLFECFTFLHSINWVFDHKLRWRGPDKE